MHIRLVISKESIQANDYILRYPLAVTSAGIPLFTKDDLFAGRALSADFTGAGWKGMLGFPDLPVLSPREAGAKTRTTGRSITTFHFLNIGQVTMPDINRI